MKEGKEGRGREGVGYTQQGERTTATRREGGRKGRKAGEGKGKGKGRQG